LSGLLIAGFPSSSARSRTVEDLWLPLADSTAGKVEVFCNSSSPTIELARYELSQGLIGPVGNVPVILLMTSEEAGRGNEMPRLLAEPLEAAGPEGFVIRSLSSASLGAASPFAEGSGRAVVVIAANSDMGLLYGAFHYVRLLQTGAQTKQLDIVDAPAVKLRLLNHWDNLDRSVERGYAGQSLWDWWKLPDITDPRYTTYARANASIGINGAVLNNVNASVESLTAPYIAKAAKLADIFRPWGVRVYLSARFSAPVELGGLRTADPLDPEVAAWWADKAAEIHAVIPDFGGFLVKANAEGQPGPQDYGRSHADGANMLAAALKPHGSIVMWRAFVYSDADPADRHKQAYVSFKPLDGKFADNVIVQVKNGAIDFQPREPFHPLLGAMPATPLMLELQITKEYLGFETHLAFLGPLFEEVLQSDTYARGPGSTVAGVVDGTLFAQPLTGVAGVANVGTDRNWTGSIFDQANWYAFGRFAWNPHLSSRDVATEWAQMTFGPERLVVEPVVDIMLRSREAVVDYMTPLGLAHLMGTGHHYGPAPWVADLARPEWNPTYYHRADSDGVGFDRTASGSNAVAQYAAPVARRFADRSLIDEKHLLWFHRVGWDERLASGRTLWEELVARYDRGLAEVGSFHREWQALSPYLDRERHTEIARFLTVQEREARWWRDASIAYFQSVSGRPLPPGVRPPRHSLQHYKSLRFPQVPGDPAN
jgi:alpha-glucuronidase